MYFKKGGIRMIQQITNRFPGISCAYWDGSGNIITECYGVSDLEKKTPVDENTIFPACSISKFVTAICLMKLQEESVIDIDAPVNRYLQQWKLLTSNGTESDATIRSIMRHTAGIVDGEDSFYGLRREDPEIPLIDILDGRTFYNNRPARVENQPGSAFEYSDAGYCVLQLLVEETMHCTFEDAVQELVFDKLYLNSTFYASPQNLAYHENSKTMTTGYDGAGIPLLGRFPPCPDLAGAGLWSTPKELLTIAKAFVTAYKGSPSFLREASAKAMAQTAESFPWAGLGIFICEDGSLMTQGWGENGQCMMKLNCRTGQISVVMTNRNPEMSQSESGVEWMVNKNFLRSNGQ